MTDVRAAVDRRSAHRRGGLVPRHRRPRRDRPRPHPDPDRQSAGGRDPGAAPRRGPARGRRHLVDRRRARPRPWLRPRAAARRRHGRRDRSCSCRHLDVVPAPADRWSHDPFAADLADGYIYGRGAVDMKAMIGDGAAGRAPARRPRHGRRAAIRPATRSRDSGATCCSPAPPTRRPAGWPARRGSPTTGPTGCAADGALNECRRRLVDDRRPAAVPDPGRREGLRPRTASRSAGRGATARCRATTTRPSSPPTSSGGWPSPGPSRVTPVMARFLELAAAALPADSGRPPRGSVGRRPGPRRGRDRGRLRPDRTRGRCARWSATPSARTSSQSGIKYNVIPGDATIEVDCRVLPGTTEADMRAQVVERLGPTWRPPATSS